MPCPAHTTASRWFQHRCPACCVLSDRVPLPASKPRGPPPEARQRGAEANKAHAQAGQAGLAAYLDDHPDAKPGEMARYCGVNAATIWRWRRALGAV